MLLTKVMSNIEQHCATLSNMPWKMRHVALTCSMLLMVLVVNKLNPEKLIDSQKWWLGSWYNYGESHFGKKAFDNAKRVIKEWGPHLSTREAFEGHIAKLKAEAGFKLI
ncbi:hypothetical protein ACFL5Z_10300 [Planctomycetota bacterium]